MTQPFTVSFNKLFAKQFEQFDTKAQDCILDFVEQFERCGLDDFTNYEGKIAPSWSNLATDNPKYVYAKGNDLWHYHIGLPEYTQRHDKYKTSDWVLHFQWQPKGTELNLVDMCYHYTCDGEFYLPDESYLEKAS